MPFSFKCSQCKKMFSRHASTGGPKRFCSHPCFINFYRTGKPVPCPMCGKETYRCGTSNRRYCSRDCYEVSRANTVTKVCAGCAAEFQVKGSIASRMTYCSRKCRIKFNGSEYRPCAACGKPFFYSGSDKKRGLKRSHCSEECRRPITLQVCATCGTEFRRCPGDTDRRFCQFSCYRRYTGETSIEKSVREALTNIGVKFVQEGSVGRYSVDFLIPTIRVAIECDGTYWHQDAVKDARKDSFLVKHGWRVFRISERKINGSCHLGNFLRQQLEIIAGAKA